MIDIIIPYSKKDEYTIKDCILSSKKNINDIIGNIYIISKEETNIEGTIWLPEDIFFTVEDILNINPNISKDRAGWYLQQMIKLYAFKRISNLNDNILILDSDVIFTNKVSFFKGKIPLYNNSDESHPAYFEIMSKLNPYFERATSDSGVSHMCIFQRKVVDEIHNLVEEYTGCTLIRAVLLNLTNLFHGFSEYELYFHYIHKAHPNLFKVRKLKYANVTDYRTYNMKESHDYIANHSWKRNENK